MTRRAGRNWTRSAKRWAKIGLGGALPSHKAAEQILALIAERVRQPV
ncbi:MAG: hypothetical protein WDN69_33190 [Aliidongia sp.]